MKTSVQNNLLTIFLEREINAKNVSEIQKEIDEIIAANPDREILFDADDLTYISSAGLRMLFDLQKQIRKGKLTVRNVSKDVYEIFDMTKFTSLMNIEKKMREISVDGA
ncbi:MAG: STAS domain-containing protein [Selenomonadaceae bacterium]|nr:STAS domain-containing protein [Selenomonadaceae bacterium]